MLHVERLFRASFTSKPTRPLGVISRVSVTGPAIQPSRRAIHSVTDRQCSQNGSYVLLGSQPAMAAAFFTVRGSLPRLFENAVIPRCLSSTTAWATSKIVTSGLFGIHVIGCSRISPRTSASVVDGEMPYKALYSVRRRARALARASRRFWRRRASTSGEALPARASGGTLVVITNSTRGHAYGDVGSVIRGTGETMTRLSGCPGQRTGAFYVSGFVICTHGRGGLATCRGCAGVVAAKAWWYNKRLHEHGRKCSRRRRIYVGGGGWGTGQGVHYLTCRHDLAISNMRAIP